MKTTSQTTRENAPNDTAVFEWHYREGPPQRAWWWYVAVIAIALLIAGLTALISRDPWPGVVSALLWGCIVLAFSLAPSRDYRARLDRHLLTVEDVKRGKVIVERNLREFASWSLVEYPEDRLNPLVRKLTLTRRDGKGAIELSLTSDDRSDEEILERIAEVIPPAPDIAPTLLQRMDQFAQRWIGWR